MTTRAAFLADIDRFLERTGLSGAALGRLAIGDKHFVQELRDGRDIQLSTLDRVRQFMADYSEAA